VDKETRQRVLEVVRSSSTMNELYEIVGFEALMKLLDQYGGKRLYVPMKYKSVAHPLVQAIGIEAAEALSYRYGGDSLACPTKTHIHNAIRDQRIVRARNEGKTIGAISDRFHLSERRVREILERNGKPCHLDPSPAQRPRPAQNAFPILREPRRQLELFPKF